MKTKSCTFIEALLANENGRTILASGGNLGENGYYKSKELVRQDWPICEMNKMTWGIVEEPEVYEFECTWERDGDFGDFIFPTIDRDFLENLLGVKTKISIEVLE